MDGEDSRTQVKLGKPGTGFLDEEIEACMIEVDRLFLWIGKQYQGSKVYHGINSPLQSDFDRDNITKLPVRRQ